jgi:hypothetical protein
MAGVGTYTGGPKRLVLHTTEGWSLESAEAAYRAKTIAPQFTVCFVTRRWAQHIDTASSASAMANLAGGVQTNRDGAIQVEIVGFADYTQDINDDDLRWLGGIIRLICQREGIDVYRHPAFVGREAGTIATTTAPQRMSFAEWDNFNGVCGHQHVPENHHWDPGHFPYERMLALTEDGDDDMARAPHSYWRFDGDPNVYKVPDGGPYKVWMPNPEALGVDSYLLGIGGFDTTIHVASDANTKAWLKGLPELRETPTAKSIAEAVIKALPPAQAGGLTVADVQGAVATVLAATVFHPGI